LKLWSTPTNFKMITYWMMFLFPSFLALMPWKATANLAKLSWGIATIALILIIGLRYQVGGDWLPYLMRFHVASGATLTDAVKIYRDPSYWYFNWLFANAGLGVWSLNLLCAVISVSGVVAIALRQPQPWVALAVAVPYILVVVCMGYTRQSAAFGLVCWALLAVQDRRTLRFLILVVVATTFHKSAVVAMPLYLFTLRRIKFRHWVLLATMLFAIVAVLITETIESQWQNYVEKQMESEGALFRVAMNFPPAIILLLWRKKLGLQDHRSRHWYWIAWIALISIIFVNLASTVVDRLGLYLLPLQMIVFAHAYRLFKEQIFRSITPIIVLMLYGAVLFVWLNYAKNSYTWIPYQFYPFAGEF
jgi:hypothetical protein